jgi:hypothetical protein
MLVGGALVETALESVSFHPANGTFRVGWLVTTVEVFGVVAGVAMGVSACVEFNSMSADWGVLVEVKPGSVSLHPAAGTFSVG